MNRERQSELTPKQTQIAELVANGFDNANIAEKLGNTPQVIKNHLRAILDKTGCNNRVQVAIWWNTRNPILQARIASLERELALTKTKLDEANRELFKWRRRCA